MKNFIILIFIQAAILCSCKNDKQPASEEKKSEEKNYFPVADYIKGQINDVDSLPSAILKKTTENNKTDSSYIKPQEFNELAQEFIMPELTKETFEKEYQQTSFVDATTQSATYTYATGNNELSLQRVDVLSTSTEVNNKVKSVYMEKRINKNDTLIIKKLFWKANKSFRIITSIKTSAQPATIKQLSVVWNDSE
jgi:hypothetical protein